MIDEHDEYDEHDEHDDLECSDCESYTFSTVLDGMGSDPLKKRKLGYWRESK